MKNQEENRGTQIRIAELTRRLTRTQRRFVVALLEYPLHKDAAKAIGISPRTASSWTTEEKDMINELSALMAEDVMGSALEIRKANLVKAMAVKAAGLDSKDEKIRQGVATEIIEWELGKAEDNMNIHMEIGGSVLRIIEHPNVSD